MLIISKGRRKEKNLSPGSRTLKPKVRTFYPLDRGGTKVEQGHFCFCFSSLKSAVRCTLYHNVCLCYPSQTWDLADSQTLSLSLALLFLVVVVVVVYKSLVRQLWSSFTGDVYKVRTFAENWRHKLKEFMRKKKKNQFLRGSKLFSLFLFSNAQRTSFGIILL